MSTRIYQDQFHYQREHAVGAILNVGCNTDAAQLGSGPGSLSAINVDLGNMDKITGEFMPVHVMADARALPFRSRFDTVVLGELLEHMDREAAVQTLREVSSVLRKPSSAIKYGGRVIITMPHDHRRDAGQVPVPEHQFYAPGVYAYHHRGISWAELYGWIAEAGLRVVERSRIHYVWGEVGSGVIAEAAC